MDCLFKDAGVTFPGHATTCYSGRFPDANWLAEQRVEVNLVEVGLQMDGVVKGPQDFEIGGGMKVDFHEKGPHLVDARQARRAGRAAR